MTVETPSHTRPAPAVLLVSIAFFAIGFLSFWSAAATLFRYPEMLFGEPYRPDALALTHLMVLGWISSLVFGAGYVILPIMAGTKLWSVRLAGMHWLLHAIGMPWMVIGFLLMDFTEVGHGGSLVFVGIVLAVINLMKTASRFNRWDPAVITFLFAFFWLLGNSLLAISMLVNKYIPLIDFDTQRLIGIHAHVGLLGFLWLVLLGASLKLFPTFLESRLGPSWLSWIGCIVFNAGLLAMAIVGFYYYEGSRLLAAWLLGGGTSLYFIDLIRVVATAQRRMDWGILTAFCGLLSGILLFVWVLAGAPAWPGTELPTVSKQMQIYFTLALFGPFTLSIYGMGTQIIPRLVWQLKFASQTKRKGLPAVGNLTLKGGLFPLWISFCGGWLYLAAGAWAGDGIGVQTGIMLMLIGTGWFFYTLSPALKAIVAEDRELSLSATDSE